MGPFASLEALVHAATEERKRLSAGSPPDLSPAPVHSPRHNPPTRSPQDSYRNSQPISSPSLTRPREYPAILPASHVPHRISPNDEPRLPDHHRPSSSSSSSSVFYPPLPPPPPLSRQQYEDEQRRLAQQERERVEQKRLEQQQKDLEQKRLEHRRLFEQRQRDDEYREKRIQEERMRERQEELARRTLEEQQRRERERLRAEELLLARRKQERQLEQQQRLNEREQRRLEELRRGAEEMEMRRRVDKFNEEIRLDQERRLREREGEERRAYEEALVKRRREEEQLLQERIRHEEESRRHDEERRIEEQRIYEEHRKDEKRLYEERRLEEQRLFEERRLDEQRQMEELRRREEMRRLGELRQQEEQQRMEEHFRQRQQEERERHLHASLHAEQEAREREALQRQGDSRMPSERPRSAHEDIRLHSLATPSAQPLTPQSAPAAIELPQPIRPYPPISGPRKSDPIPIKRPANHDDPVTLHLSSSAPGPSSTDGERPTKKQRYSESPPPSSIEPYPRVVALPPPITTEFLFHRPGSSIVRRPGSGQGRKQVHTGLGDVAERERERIAAGESHRIISPLGRRSPPGSQIGRITAAKKSDEARRADEAAAAAAIADVRKESHTQVKKVDDGPRTSTSPTRSETKAISQECGPPVIALAQDSSISKIEELIARKPAEDTSRKMSLDAVMNDAAVDEPVVVKMEPPLATSFDAPLRSKEQQPKKDTAPRPSRDDRAKIASSRSSDSHRIVVDAQTLFPNTQEAKENQEVRASESQQQKQQQDPHEWLLDHYAQSPSIPHQLPPEPPRSPSPSISPILAKTQPDEKNKKRARTPPVEAPKPTVPPRSVSPDADAALERELAELMAEDDEPVAPVQKREPDDMDIDLAVAEILEEGDNSKDTPMEVDGADDVEDELLSLLDDRPTTAPTGRKTATPTIPAAPFKAPPLLKTNVDELKRSSPVPTASTSPAATSPLVRPPSALPGLDRGSMPPPSAASSAPRSKDKDEEVTKKGEPIGATSMQAAKKKKESGSKVSAKKTKETASSATAQTMANNKQQKTKATANKKSKATDGVAPTLEAKASTKQSKASAAAKKSGVASHIATSRSRSTSVMPAGSVEPESERKSEEKEEEKEEIVDDKLYCVCKTKYDEERFMIACDRCDEWYHTTCVNMPEMEVELVDQFFCPPCIEQNPHLNLKTTYKQRCLNGLRHPDPDSPKACHKPARGAISKYCSDECGVEYMQSRIDAWAKKGGKKEELWESVKHAEKREGIAVCVDEKVKSDLDKKKEKQTKMDREMERLQGLLNQVVKMREEIKSGMEILVWRERLLQLASERAEHIDQCGWDQRLCFGEEEWQDYGAGVLESYEAKDESRMQVEDGEEEDEEWWCPGQKSCKRHNGWQTLRYKDICKEREKKEELLTSLTTRERQLRKRIEDLTDPSSRKSINSAPQAPLKLSNTKLPNGHTKSRGTTETLKKGKKRKAPAS